jgi:hypothetical protein
VTAAGRASKASSVLVSDVLTPAGDSTNATTLTNQITALS